MCFTAHSMHFVENNKKLQTGRTVAFPSDVTRMLTWDVFELGSLFAIIRFYMRPHTVIGLQEK